MQREKRLLLTDRGRWSGALALGLLVMVAATPAHGAEGATGADEVSRVEGAVPDEVSSHGSPATAQGASAAKDYDPTKNIVAIHDSSSKQYGRNCRECHADVLSQHSQDPSIPAAHLAMFSYAAGREGSDQQCRWCHRTVDLTSGAAQPEAKSTGNLRRHTDVTLCTLCHGPYRGGPGRQLYQAGLSPANPDGPFLYELVCSACHRPLATSQVRGKSASEIQHKIDENEGGMGALSVLTPEEVAAIAAALEGGGDD